LKKKHKGRGSKSNRPGKSERRRAKRQNPNDNGLGSIQKQKKDPKTKQTNKKSNALANPNNKTWIVRIIIIEGARFPWPQTETLTTGIFYCKSKETFNQSIPKIIEIVGPNQN
jgi:hypothetical protein